VPLYIGKFYEIQDQTQDKPLVGFCMGKLTYVTGKPMKVRMVTQSMACSIAVF
jgi:hypothetical protein